MTDPILGLISLSEIILRILFSYVVIRCKAVTLCRFLAMASRSRAIPAEEWERNKETIKDLFARKRLTQVIEEMKQEHNFDAT